MEQQEIMARIEALESHVARLEGILHVLLEQIELGAAQENAAAIRAALPRIEHDEG